MKPRIALFAYVTTAAVVHAIVAFWTPLQGDDWNHWVWAAQHAGQGAAAWLRAHHTFSDAVGYLLARSRTCHVLLSPAVVLALVVGLFTFATRRLPRATWSDLLGLALVSALLWAGQPHAGVAWFHIPSVAMHVWGTAIAVWFVIPLRCNWQVPRALWPVLALAGYCTGTSTRAIATLVLVGLIVAIVRTPRERRVPYLWLALAGLVIGTAAGYAKSPWIELGRVFRRGFEPNLVLLKLPIEECGRIVALVVLLLLVERLLPRARASDDDRPEPTGALRWLLAWFATSIWCLFGPHYYEATFFPATCLLVIAALPYMQWLATSRVLGRVVIAFAIGVHAIVWPLAVVKYHHFGDEGVVRWARLATSGQGQIANVPRYSEALPGYWFGGDDFDKVNLRGIVAAEVFGLRDIVIEPSFRRLELNPRIAVRFESQEVSEADLRAARVPSVWSGVPEVAREQFEALVKRIEMVTGKVPTARLVVTNVPIAERGTRPLYAAWIDSTGTMIPKTAVSPIDENMEISVRMYGPDVKKFDEAYIVHAGKVTKTPYRNGTPRTMPVDTEPHAIVICNKERCLLEDAFAPHF